MSEQSKESKQRIIAVFTLAGLIVTFFLIFLFIFKIKSNSMTRNLAMRVVCGSHLSRLGKTLITYVKDHNNHYPEPNEWCDILMKDEDFDKKILLCMTDKIGPCSYAMNPNCKPNSEGDIVLLFETKAGWNQNGGPELLTDNHKGGSNILFNGGSVLFVEIKDFNSLKWK